MGLFSGIADALGIGSGGLSAIGSIGAGLLGYQGQQETNQANSAQSQAQMDFQREMSNTAYQRATADMKAAGLNPMLAYQQGGASTPGGAMAVMGNKVAAGQSAAESYLTRENAMATNDNIKSQTALNAAQALRVAAQTRTEGFSAQHVEQVVRRLLDENSDKDGWSLGTSNRKAAESRAYGLDLSNESAKRLLEGGAPELKLNAMKQEIATGVQRARALAAGATLDELDAKRARNEANMQDTWVGKALPYAGALGSVVNSAVSGIRGFRLLNPASRGGWSSSTTSNSGGLRHHTTEWGEK